MPRKTAAMQRRLTSRINELLSGANIANAIYSEAVPCRWEWWCVWGSLWGLLMGLGSRHKVWALHLDVPTQHTSMLPHHTIRVMGLL
jgi:hypothetical protein